MILSVTLTDLEFTGVAGALLIVGVVVGVFLIALCSANSKR